MMVTRAVRGAGDDVFHTSGDGAADTLDGGSGTDTATDRDVGTDSVSNIENL